MNALLLLVIGLGAGVLSGLFGVGGGIVIVPSLLLFVGMNLPSAIGTSLGALLLPVGLLAAIQYSRDGHLDSNAATWIAVGLFFGAWGGALLGQRLHAPTLQRGFALLLVIVAVRLWLTSASASASR